MKHRVAVCWLGIWIWGCGLTASAAAADGLTDPPPAPPRSMFVSVIEEVPVLADRARIFKMLDYARRARVRTLFVQVYRSNRSWFRSRLADDAPYEEGLRAVGEDPFALLVREAHARGIEVHAWMNLMSLSGNVRAPLLQKYGPDILTRNDLPKQKLSDYRIDNQYFLEPGDPRVTDEIAAIVGEVVRAYPDLDGVQFDYIRYPDWKPAYGRTEVNERRFMEATGLTRADISETSPAWQNWKRDQVTGLVDRLSREARAAHPGIQVSTTGLTGYSRASREAYQDWSAWVNRGLIDFVTLMAYARDGEGFKNYITDARRQLGDLKKANLAVGAYRFTHDHTRFAEQWDLCRDSGARGCAAFFYGNLYEHPRLARVLTQA